ncbi:formylglycine-generating enzyme family protein [Methanolobus sp. ZRKC3]|uniref:formylglycine-generating enzyme family protein n=1 Tax=Methanolobus sp. ZRKC3 TaxID=3125786 RepID=UPI003249E686
MEGKSEETYVNSIGMEFVSIPAGEFDMGSLEDEKNWYRNERPQHRVKIGKAFHIGKYAVKQKEWIEIMGFNPSRSKGDDHPVDKVSWSDAQDFISKLNEKEGTDKYRLPSEAEWEYACRAQTSTRYSFGDDDAELTEHAWYDVDESTGSSSSGQKKPNPWGLYDMHGNLWEWMQDRYHDSYEGAPTDGSAWEEDDSGKDIYVLRGGAWSTRAEGCRSASRYYYPADGRRSRRSGFRLLMEI